MDSDPVSLSTPPAAILRRPTHWEAQTRDHEIICFILWHNIHICFETILSKTRNKNKKETAHFLTSFLINKVFTKMVIASVRDNTRRFFPLFEFSGCPRQRKRRRALGEEEKGRLGAAGFLPSTSPKDDVDPAVGVDDVAETAHRECERRVLKGLLHLPPPKGA
jgi:hypothetical protein